MLQRLRLPRAIGLILTFGLIAAAFQNCTPMSSSVKADEGSTTQFSGNGDGYTGKGELFRNFDAQSSCAQLDRDGKPLPNGQIFYQSKTSNGAKEPYVVRENCADVSPRQVAKSQLKSDASGNLIFKNRSFKSYVADNEFQVLAASCPAGKSAIAGATRKNLIVNSQDWTEQPVYQGWMWHSGIVALLNGSIRSLPAYELVRHDPAFPEEFRRISQMKKLAGNTDYAFSFLAKRGTRDSITFRYWRIDEKTGNEEYIIIDLNLTTGVASSRLNAFMPRPTATVAEVGDGYFITIYFRTTANGGENFSDFGISPTALSGVTKVGDSVYASAAQLEATETFCR